MPISKILTLILTLIIIFTILFLLQDMCPMQVFDIEDMGGKGKEDRAVVARPRDCTMCRYVNPLPFLPSLSCPTLPFPSFHTCLLLPPFLPSTHHLVSHIRFLFYTKLYRTAPYLLYRTALHFQ